MSTGYGGGFTFIDLFAGVGGFHAALSQLGGHCLYAAEKDKAAAAVYRKAWPTDDEDGFAFTEDINDDVKPIDEATTLDDLARMAATGAGTISNKVPRDFDVLAAGFPCQAFSKSGHQRGVLDQTRGTLFYNILRIVAERRPKIVFLENVRNLVGPRHRQTTFATIVDALEALGYHVAKEPTVISPHRIPASMGGGPQIRERVYIMAIRADLVPDLDDLRPFPGFTYPATWDPKRDWSVTETQLLDKAPAAITDAWLSAHCERSIAERLRALRAVEDHHIVAGAEWLDGWEALLNAVVVRRKLESGSGISPFPGSPIWLAVADPRWEADQRHDADTHDRPWKHEFLNKSVKFIADYKQEIEEVGLFRRILGLPNSWRKLEWQAGDATTLSECLIQLRPSGVRVKRANYTPALVAINQTPILGAERRRLTPYEAGRLQGFPDNVYIAMKDSGQLASECYKQFGNAVHVGAVTYALAQFMFHYFKDEAPTDPNLAALWAASMTGPASLRVE
ncbi:MAG: DNA (cytosine-5-)-methyltransferase [Solirubrobacteraceae bacterium]